MSEAWKDVVGFEGYYQVSSLGRVRGVDRPCPSGRNKTIEGKVLKLQKTTDSYPCVRIRKDYKSYSFTVHRLVAVAFLGYREDMTVNHIDRNRDNNSVTNLEWMSHKDNVRHSSREGRYRRFGVRNSRSKLTLKDVAEIRRRHSEGVSPKQIKPDYPYVCMTTIYKVIRRESYVR